MGSSAVLSRRRVDLHFSTQRRNDAKRERLSMAPEILSLRRDTTAPSGPPRIARPLRPHDIFASLRRCVEKRLAHGQSGNTPDAPAFPRVLRVIKIPQAHIIARVKIHLIPPGQKKADTLEAPPDRAGPRPFAVHFSPTSLPPPSHACHASAPRRPHKAPAPPPHVPGSRPESIRRRSGRLRIG
jgi:hypothetical protein